MHLYAIIANKLEFKTFAIRLDDKILIDLSENKLEFSQLDYISLSSKSKMWDRKEVHLIYRVDDREKISDKVYELVGVDRERLNRGLGSFVEGFREFRMEKNLIKALKFKTEFINASESPTKYDCLDRVIKKLVLKDN